MKLSIIVPVYNVEKYIYKCIKSLEEQDFNKENYEIIVVNDGSLDNSISIVKQLQTEFNNIHILNKNNGGLSSARNFGLQHAKGDYIWFVDSDDYIEKNVLKSLIYKLENEKLDLLGLNSYDVWEEKENETYDARFQPLNIISGEEYIKSYPIRVSACFVIIKKDILIDNKIFFMEGIIHEDNEFALRLHRHIKRMSFERNRIYNYVHREGSITTTKNENQILKSLHSWQKILRITQETFKDASSYSLYARYWINNYKFYAINSLFFSKLNSKDKRKEFKELNKVNAFSIGKNRLDAMRNIRCKLLCIKPLYFIFMQIFKLK